MKCLVLETLSLILRSIDENPWDLKVFLSFVEAILVNLEGIEKEPGSEKDLLGKAIALLGDIIQIFGDHVREEINKIIK